MGFRYHIQVNHMSTLSRITQEKYLEEKTHTLNFLNINVLLKLEFYKQYIANPIRNKIKTNLNKSFEILTKHIIQF